MALRANAITTVAICKTQLDIPTADTSQDAFLERLINSASEQIERYCNRPFVSISVTEYHDGNRTNEIILKKAGATSISSVNLDSSRIYGADTLVPATDYALIFPSILKKISGTWASAIQSIKVIYTAGFSPVPADIEDACILLVEHRYRLKNDRRLGRSSTSKLGENISYATDWPSEAISLLDPYRIYNFIGESMAVIK